MNKLNIVNEIIKMNEDLKINFNITDIRNVMLNGLKLDYSPNIPIESYLDLAMENRNKISRIILEIIKDAKVQDDISLSKLQSEIEKINTEIRELERSKRRKFLKFLTSFIVDNKSIIGGCLIGTSLGLTGHGFTGYGIGAGAGVITKILSEYDVISIPSEGKEIFRSFLKKLEPAYDKLLSYYLSKDIKIIQVWEIKQKLKSF